MAADLFAALVRAEFAASLAILAVLALRGPTQRSLGARAAYALWLVPAFAAVASLLPARIAAAPSAASLAPIEPAPVAFAETATRMAEAFGAPAPDLSGPLLGLWLAGVAVSAGLVVFGQFLFVRRLGVLTRDRGFCRAQSGDFGPVVVGALAPRIVVPFDFEARFSAPEREVILAHERAHLAGGDPYVNLAVATFQCLSWFNPLAYIAAHVVRLDQELACDASVVARFPAERRRYAETLLKTQIAPLAPPLGCAWPARSADPLKQRLAMLKSALPGPARKLAGAGLVALLGVLGGYAAWAAQPARPPETPPARFSPDFMWNGDVNAVRPGDGTPLIIAAKHGDSSAIMRLLARGADVNRAAPGDGNPLITAARWGNVSVAQVLLDHGAHVDANVPGDETPLITAARMGQLDMVRLLVERGANVNLAVRKDGLPLGEIRSPLSVARRNGHLDVADYLVSHGATG